MLLSTGNKEKKLEELVESIVLEHYNQYYRLAFGYVHNENDAYDIVQNGVYKALRSSHTLRNPEYAKTWVYRIILNEIFTYIKASQKESDSYNYFQDTYGNEISFTEDTYENIDLHRALESLPPQDKAIIVMKYFDDLKLDEIAFILDENISTIKSRLYRSMKKLKLTLTED